MNNINGFKGKIPKILVVDDTLANLKLISNILISNGLQVRAASSGKLALRTIAVEIPDLILLDVKMSDMDGFEVCELLKKDPKTKSIPVIFISALSDSLDKIKGFEVGGVDYIVKPFEPEEVIRRVRIHLKLYKLTENLEEEVKERTKELEQEIKERKVIENNLRESEEKYSRLINNSPYITYVYDTIKGAIFWSKQVEKILGFKVDRIKSNPYLWMNSLIEKDRERIKNLISHLKPGDEIEFEYQCIDIKGNLHWFRDRVFNVVSKGDSLIIEGISQDITERKEVEEKNKKLEEQLRRSQKMETIGTLAGGIAHDFNNILTPILGFSQMAMLRLDNKEALNEAYRIIYESANRAKGLIKQILTYARQVEEEKKDVNLFELVNEVIKLLKPTIPSTIEICFEAKDSDIIIFADPIQIHQVLMNLCTNAYHAMETTGGQLKIEMSKCYLSEDDLFSYFEVKPGMYARISIIDTGIGIDKESVENIFEPFFTTKETGKGTGLGLSVVLGIVKAHNGTLHVYSEIGVGSKFEVFLPLSSGKSETRPDSIIYEVKGSERIVIVDDETIITSMFKAFLPGMGYSVQIFNDSMQAEKYIKSNLNNIDMIVTDLTMPKMTGIDLIKSIRKENQEIPIIMMSGYYRDMSQSEIKKLGISTIFTKPIQIEDFLSIIRGVFDKKV